MHRPPVQIVLRHREKNLNPRQKGKQPEGKNSQSSSRIRNSRTRKQDLKLVTKRQILGLRRTERKSPVLHKTANPLWKRLNLNWIQFCRKKSEVAQHIADQMNAPKDQQTRNVERGVGRIAFMNKINP